MSRTPLNGDLRNFKGNLPGKHDRGGCERAIGRVKDAFKFVVVHGCPTFQVGITTYMAASSQSVASEPDQVLELGCRPQPPWLTTLLPRDASAFDLSKSRFGRGSDAQSRPVPSESNHGGSRVASFAVCVLALFAGDVRAGVLDTVDAADWRGRDDRRPRADRAPQPEEVALERTDVCRCPGAPTCRDSDVHCCRAAPCRPPGWP